MKFTIPYRGKGRIRIRFGPEYFTRGQGFKLGQLLMEEPLVTDIVTNETNGSVLVCFDEDENKEIGDYLIAFISNIDVKNLDEVEAEEFQVKAEINRSYINRLGKMVGFRYFVKWFLPMPLVNAITLYKATGYIREAFKSLRAGKIDVAVLDGSSVTASLLQGQFGTASSIMFLLSVTELLEEFTKERAKIALTESLRINVDSVWTVMDGEEVKIPMTDLKLGQNIIIRTGTMIPVDGTIVDGECTINEASMTGESIPVNKHGGSTVYAGTVVEDGNILVEVRALPENTRINKIVDFVEGSEKFKADIQSKAESLADRIVPFSFIGAAAVFILTGNWRKAVSVLMVDYSCAIKLATPITVISGIREASNHNIMVKGGKYLEELTLADTVVFDKTGTLTEAEPKLVKVVPFAGFEEREVLKIAACIEEHFPHSVARAIVNGAAERGIDHREEHAEVEYVVAHGIATTLNGKKTIIGSGHFIFEDSNVRLSDSDKDRLLEIENGYSCVYLAMDEELIGCLCVEDPPREEAEQVIAEMKAMGIKEVIMLTGDGEKAASAVANRLGIDSYKAEVLPEEKAGIIQELKAKGRRIIMVGDGINDSPALASADVSIAMRDASDIAREVADITLLSSDLRQLLDVIALGKGAMKRISNNYKIIVGFNSALLGLGLFGIISPVASATLHNLSTMAISLHSTRALLPAPKESENP